jgi:hypothetical protein
MSTVVSEHVKARADRNALANCLSRDLSGIASELGMSSSELLALSAKTPSAADEVQKVLVAIGIDPNHLSRNDPLVMRDLQRLCTTCTFKKKCNSDLINGKAAQNYRDYCPNAFTIDALIEDPE